MVPVRLSSLAVLCGVVTALGAGVASADPPFNNQPNQIVNAMGENGLSGWDANGFVVAQSGQPNTPPSDDGPDVFMATVGGATMTQTVSLTGVASAIDSSDEMLQTYGFFGGSGAGPDGVGMTVQLLDGNGKPVGAPTQVGPASASDRLNGTLVVPCQANIVVPPGVRAAQVTLTAAGSPTQPSTGIAYDPQLYTGGLPVADSRFHTDSMFNTDGLFHAHSVFFPPYEGGTVEYDGVGQGSGCQQAVFVPAGQPLTGEQWCRPSLPRCRPP